MGKSGGSKGYSAGGGAGLGGTDDGGGAQVPLPATHQDADVSYHTAEWHAARIAAMTVRMTDWGAG
jgi:hypothetical protein